MNEKFFEKVNNKHIFPRDFSFGNSIYRRKLYSITQLDIAMRSTLNVFVSLFSDWQIYSRVFDCLFAEIDETHFLTLARKTIKIFEHLQKAHITPMVFYTGGRSTHFYVCFKNLRIANYGAFARTFWRGFKFYAWLDSKVIGDFMRITRVPNSLHSKTGLVCVYVPNEYLTDETSFKRYVMSQQPIDDFDVVDNSEVIEPLAEKFREESKQRRIVTNSLFSLRASLMYPPCIAAYVKELVEIGELEHYRRVQLCLFLKNICKTDEERESMKIALLQLFSQYANDYDEHLTQYQLNWLFGKNYSCYSCDKAKQLGLCILDEFAVCKFYPSINHHLKYYDAQKVLCYKK